MTGSTSLRRPSGRYRTHTSLKWGAGLLDEADPLVGGMIGSKLAGHEVAVSGHGRVSRRSGVR